MTVTKLVGPEMGHFKMVDVSLYLLINIKVEDKISKYKSAGVFCGMYFIIHTEKGLFFIFHKASHNNIETSPSAEAPRRVHSGPRERTTHLLEERGEGDGSETRPRTESRRYYFLHTRIYINLKGGVVFYNSYA